MKDTPELIEIETLKITLSLLQSRFTDLAAAFAKVDPNAAGSFVQWIESDLARALFAFKHELTERVGGSGNHVLKAVAGNLKSLLARTKERMAEIAKPN